MKRHKVRVDGFGNLSDVDSKKETLPNIISSLQNRVTERIMVT